MKRRDVIKGMLAVPVAGAFVGCRHNHEPHPPLPPAGGGTLKVIFHGPFAVILPKEIGEGPRHNVRVFIPFDPESKHEFRFPSPGNLFATEANTSGHKTHRFELTTDGLIENDRLPYIDRGFDDFKFDVGKWEPRLENYFVYVELPMPDVITFIPPAENVIFEGGRPGVMPIDHILEYKVRDMSKVRFRDREDKPLSCTDLYSEYEKQWHEAPKKEDPALTQRPHLRDELASCSKANVRTLFFGVGLNRGNLPDGDFHTFAGNHAKAFFNEVLLTSFPNAPNLARKRLQSIGDYGQPCQPSARISDSGMLMPAVARTMMQPPHLRMVTSVADCRAGGNIGFTG